MNIGDFNDLTILRFTSVGAYLGDEEGNDVLLPNKYIDDSMEVDDLISVFVYRDSEDRPVATTEMPFIQLNTFAYLKVTSVSHFGAFVDWGLEKELMIPFKEQNKKLEEGQTVLVYLQLDESTDRVFGSTRTNKYLVACEEKFEGDQRVDILVCDTTDLGVKVIVNNKYSGLIFNNDISRQIRRGERTGGYVYSVREDGKLDIRLEKDGYVKVGDSTDKLLAILKKNGKIKLTDKSDPDDIREAVGMSKKTFKQAVGALYKQKLVRLDPTEIVYIG